MPRNIYDELWYRIAQAINTLVGCLFIVIGIAGLWDLPLEPVSQISFLLEPTSLGDYFDWTYWYSMIFVGGWLVLFFWVRPAAVTAIALIVLKWLVLGMVPLS